MVYGQTQMHSQRSVFVQGKIVRIARLAAWQRGSLWSFLCKEATSLKVGAEEGWYLMPTQGRLIFGDDILNTGDSVLFKVAGSVVCQVSSEMEALIYSPSQDAPCVEVMPHAEQTSTLTMRPSSLFTALGIPVEEKFSFNELIWAKAQHPHFAAEPQMTPHDTDVVATVAPLSVLRSS